MVCPWGRNYYHWLLDCLTRLEGLEYYQNQIGLKPSLIIESNPTAWQVDSLKLLGYEPTDCITWNYPRMQVGRLVIPLFRRSLENGGVLPMACRWLRQRMLNNIAGSESRDLFFHLIYTFLGVAHWLVE